ncbi:ATP-binding protein [Leucothrix arctica]|uniref:AAA+ ATPase domain-containing protein n=1 Tax=Leucothrix arctica TaxID=1481894 RepID=A0A317CLV2_9GAMM|nr:ATP-binding protein [Leucothrix arctica]PWQ98423.1 hypothetical protein DKT75_04680 [Leucothrix arctica]
MSQLENLSAIDFEDLCRDLARAETGVRFSAFGAGPDGGIDGRFSQGNETTILQCKHYLNSSFSDLERAAKKEVDNIKRLKPDRYLFVTSQSLTPKKVEKLTKIFHPFLKGSEDIWGKEDIHALLRKNPRIEASHIKLWLSSTAVLERILSSGLEAFTEATKGEILDEIKVYTRNPSFDEAVKVLEQENILIISGPSGVGKTTLAKILTYKYLNDEWKFYAIRSLDEGFVKLEENNPTIFFFDDFLGQIELRRDSLNQNDTKLSTFVKRVRKSKNTRFILTTRGHIFEEARRLSDHIDNKKLQLAKYLLDVGLYSREIKARILFNHISVSDLSNEHFASLLKDDWLQKIIDHKNYNPRVIASVSSECLDKIDPREYPQAIENALNSPDTIWRKPFLSLNTKSKNLLYTLFFCRESGERIESIKESYSALHHSVSRYYNQPTEPSDFEEALRSLESGFIKIDSAKVSFINPSVQDFLKEYLVDKTLISLLPKTAIRPEWAYKLWTHIKLISNSAKERKDFSCKFLSFANEIDSYQPSKIILDTEKEDRSVYGLFEPRFEFGLSYSKILELLFNWWSDSDEYLFLEKALSFLKKSPLKVHSLISILDLPDLHNWVDDSLENTTSIKHELLIAIEYKFLEFMNQGVSIEELNLLLLHLDDYFGESTPLIIQEKLDSLIDYEFEHTEESVSSLDTEDELVEYGEQLTFLSGLTHHDSTHALTVIQECIDNLEVEDDFEQEVTHSPKSNSTGEAFDDNNLKSLFAQLIKN